jgi:hypothetical protein
MLRGWFVRAGDFCNKPRRGRQTTCVDAMFQREAVERRRSRFRRRGRLLPWFRLLPAGDACSFSPATVTPSGSAAVTTTLTVTTAATAASLHWNRQPLFPAAALAGVLCFIGFRKRRSLQLMLLLAASVAGLGLLSGCGGGSSGGRSSGPQPVISTVTVTANSGPLAHSATFSLTVN